MKKTIKYSFYRFMCNITFGKARTFYKNKKDFYKDNKKQLNNPVSIENSLDYNHLRHYGRNARTVKDFELNNIGLVTYHALNKMKELDLKRKIRDGKKARVLFLLDQPSKLSAISVYENMLESDIFEPFIVLYNNLDGYFETNTILYNDHKKGLTDLSNMGYKIFDGYDEDKNIIPVENFKPDIIITNAPYLDYSNTLLTNTFLNLNYLVCYLPYHFGTVNNYDYHYNNRRIITCWKNFVSSREDYKEHLKYSEYCGSNVVLSGYPKLDSYAKPICQCNIPSKIDNGKPIVIYAPHHSIGDNWGFVSLSTFHIYCKYFLDLVKSNIDINFVFKPHPDLSIKVVEKGLMTYEEYQNYIEEWNSLPNGFYMSSGDYIDLFRKADLLIQDSGSFIGEWLPTDKPCMYLINPGPELSKYMDGFSTIGRKILEKYYLCHNLDDINKYFKMIMFDNLDPLKQERVNIKNEIYTNIGCAGKKIVEYLEILLRD